MVTMPRATPVMTTQNSRESATAATTLSRLKARSASSTPRTTDQKVRPILGNGSPRASAAAEVRAEQPDLQCRRTLPAEQAVDGSLQETQEARPGDRVVPGQLRDHRPQHRRIINGENALQID